MFKTKNKTKYISNSNSKTIKPNSNQIQITNSGTKKPNSNPSQIQTVLN